MMIFFTEEWCKNKWKAIRDKFVRMKIKVNGSGSEAVHDRDFDFREQMAFLLPHIQKRNSLDTFQTHSEDEEAGEDDAASASRPSTPQSQAETPATPPPSSSPTRFRTVTTMDDPSRSVTPSTSSQSIAPPLHRRVQALTQSQAKRSPSQSRRRSTSTVPIDQELIDILKEPASNVPPIPDEQQAAYHYLMSLLPRFMSLSFRSRCLAQARFHNVLFELEEGERAERHSMSQNRPHATSFHPHEMYRAGSQYFQPEPHRATTSTIPQHQPRSFMEDLTDTLTSPTYESL